MWAPPSYIESLKRGSLPNPIQSYHRTVQYHRNTIRDYSDDVVTDAEAAETLKLCLIQYNKTPPSETLLAGQDVHLLI